MVITGKHILHSAFYLAATLLCVAVYFILLRAEFLAAVQILVYMGAIVVLILFALMLTRTKVGVETNISNNQKVFAALTAVILFVSLALVFSYAKIDTVAENSTALKISSIKDFSSILFTKYTLPFEIASILLLASLVGSIVIAMKEKQETEGNETVKGTSGAQGISGGAAGSTETTLKDASADADGKGDEEKRGKN
jgi:NADH-quinone oxidoreductase subunit J